MTARALARDIPLPHDRPRPGAETTAAKRPTGTTCIDAKRLAEPCVHCCARGNCDAARLMALVSGPDPAPRPQPHLLPKGKHIFFEGDRLHSVLFIRKGTVKTYLTSLSGDEYVTGFLLPGEIPGLDALFGAGRHNSSAITLEDTELCAIPAEHLLGLTRNTPGGMRWLLGLAGSSIVRSNHQRVLHNTMKAETRLGSFLLDLSRRLRQRGCPADEFSLSMSRQDIANHLGMALETVCRLMGAFQRDGVLAVDHRRITILDSTALSAR